MILKGILTSAFLAATFSSALAADAKEDVTKAAKALAEKGNYSWKTTVGVPANSQFTPGPTEGKADKDISYITMSFRDNKTEAYIKGDKAAYTDQNGEWQSAADDAGGEGPGRFMGRFIRNIKPPAGQAEEIAGLVKEFKKDGDAYSGDLTEEGAKTLIGRARGRGGAGGGDAPEVKGAKGTAKFWVKDGVLSKFEYQVKGQTKNRNGEDVDVDRTTTTEIKDVGTTKLTVPETVKKKLA